MKQAKLQPLHATALVAVGSAVTYLPIYFSMHGVRLAQLPLRDFAIQSLFQGVLVTIVSLILYGRSMKSSGHPAERSLARSFQACRQPSPSFFFESCLARVTGSTSWPYPSACIWRAVGRCLGHCLTGNNDRQGLLLWVNSVDDQSSID
jgi:hypothetical protein